MIRASFTTQSASAPNTRERLRRRLKTCEANRPILPGAHYELLWADGTPASPFCFRSFEEAAEHALELFPKDLSRLAGLRVARVRMARLVEEVSELAYDVRLAPATPWR